MSKNLSGKREKASESSSDSEEEKKTGGLKVQWGREKELSAPSGGVTAEAIAAFLKERKISLNLPYRRDKQPNFGICFDIDGVLARGTIPIPAAQEGIKMLLDAQGTFKYPVAFVTNALFINQDKADQLSGWFGVPVSKDQIIQSPSALEVFEKFVDKNCLVVGQGKIIEISNQLGLKKLVTVDDVARARPLLDVIDHEKRKLIDPNFVNQEFKPIEAILLMGEPKHWESSLQIIVDVLLTHGKPDSQEEIHPRKHLPVIACNMDLRFMERCQMPRLAHGAFLVCLEALYKKVTGTNLQYAALMGKPSEITYRFAEHVLAREALKLGYTDPLKTMYLIGDNPMSDIVGSNLYQQYIDRMKYRRRRFSTVQKLTELKDPDLPESRNIPVGTKFLPQTVDAMESVLVCTGVYRKGEDPQGDGSYHHGHRDFPKNTDLHVPTCICDDAKEALEYILLNEDII